MVLESVQPVMVMENFTETHVFLVMAQVIALYVEVRENNSKL